MMLEVMTIVTMVTRMFTPSYFFHYSQSDSEDDDDDEAVEVPITFPEALHAKLEDDCYFITSKKQVNKYHLLFKHICGFKKNIIYFEISIFISRLFQWLD